MKHDPIELLARMAHVHATGEAGERVPWALLAAEQREQANQNQGPSRFQTAAE